MQASTRKRIIGVVVAVVVAILVAVGVRFAFSQFGGSSTEDTVSQAVEELKSQTTLPQQVDEITTLDDVTAEGDTIHYQYTISGGDTSALTESALSDSILPSLCSTAETKSLLDKDVTMRYSYTVEESGDDYDLSFTKADC